MFSKYVLFFLDTTSSNRSAFTGASRAKASLFTLFQCFGCFPPCFFTFFGQMERMMFSTVNWFKTNTRHTCTHMHYPRTHTVTLSPRGSVGYKGIPACISLSALQHTQLEIKKSIISLCVCVCVFTGLEAEGNPRRDTGEVRL